MSNCSVIMVSHYTGPILFASINSVLKQKSLADLVVVDNGNPPDVLARLRQMALTEPRLKVVTGNGNIGFAKGTNIGAKSATGYFLLLLNPDCLLPPDALSGMLATFESNPDAILVGCETLGPRGKPLASSIRPLLTPGSAIKDLFSVKYTRPGDPNAKSAYEVPAVSGALMCLRRRDFDRLNGLDEAFFVRGAGMDLCMRINKFGGKIVFNPNIKVTRLHTNDESFKRIIDWHRARGRIHYMLKHFSNRYPLGFGILTRLSVMSVFALKVAIDWIRRQLRPTYKVSHTIPAKRLMVLASGLADLPETKEFAGKTILVTGATSQVGLCVIRRLIAAGAGVLAISRNDPIPFQHEHLRWIKGDLTDASLHLDGYLADAVVHSAPLWHLPPTLELLADAEAKRIIAFGSTSLFGKVLSRNHHEREIVEKLGRAEADISERCNALRINWTIFRPTLIYGVGLDANVTTLAKMINFLSFFPVYPPAFGRRQPVHADDLAIAVLQALDNKNTYGKSYNMSGGEVLSYREMLEDIFKVCGKKLRIEENTMLPFILDVMGKLTGKKHINGEIARRMNDDLMFFHDDAKRDFGFSPRPFLSGGIKDIEGY